MLNVKQVLEIKAQLESVKSNFTTALKQLEEDKKAGRIDNAKYVGMRKFLRDRVKSANDKLLNVKKLHQELTDEDQA